MKNILFLFLVFSFTTSFAQAELIFESTLYIEDAIGNRDTVTFGLATGEEPNFFNPALGEIELFTPFDSILDVRGITWNDYDHQSRGLSKRVITHVVENSYDEDEGCYVNQVAPAFLIHAKYLPVTLYWDHNDFNDVRCREATTIFTHYLPATFPTWQEFEGALEESVCASVNNSFTTSFPDFGGFEFSRTLEIEGGEMKKIGGIAISYSISASLPSYCNIDTSLTISTQELYTKPALDVYPNPVQGIMSLGSDIAEDYVVIDISGRVWAEGNSNSIDLYHLPKGIYFLKIRERRATKFVKE